MRSYTQTLPLEHYRALEKLASARGVSVSEFMRNNVIPTFLGSIGWGASEPRKAEVTA